MQTAQLPSGEIMMFGDDVTPEQMDALVQQRLGQNPAPSMQEQRNGLLGQGVQMLEALAGIIQQQSVVIQEQTQVLGQIASGMAEIRSQMAASSKMIHDGMTAPKTIVRDSEGKPVGLKHA